MASIETRTSKDGTTKTYRVIWRVNGEKQTSPTMDSPDEAEKYRRIIEGKQAEGLNTQVSLTRRTFRSFAENWYLDRPVTEENAGTRRKVRSHLDAQLLPAFGDLAFFDLNRHVVQRWINTLAEPLDEDAVPLAGSSIRSLYSTLVNICKIAAADGYFPNGSPVGQGLVVLPPNVRDRRQFLTHGELDHLLAVCLDLFPQWYAFIHTGAMTGMRISEIRGLVRSNYNSLHKVLMVEGAVRRGEVGRRRDFIGPTKTSNRRRVELDVHDVEVLNAQLATHAFDLIFPSGKGEIVNYPHFREDVWLPLVEAAGFPQMHFHDLRHTHISHWLGAGVEVHAVAERVGHANKAMTMNLYGHCMPGQQRSALDRVREDREMRAALRIVSDG